MYDARERLSLFPFCETIASFLRFRAGEGKYTAIRYYRNAVREKQYVVYIEQQPLSVFYYYLISSNEVKWFPGIFPQYLQSFPLGSVASPVENNLGYLKFSPKIPLVVTGRYGFQNDFFRFQPYENFVVFF